MPRSIWSGSVSFGLVNVPVKLYTAVRSHDVRFNQIDRETHSRIRYRKVAEETGEEVDEDRIVKGFQMDDGRYVTLEPDEVEAVEPEKSRAISIEDFVDLDEVDPVYFDRTYYLEPDGEAARRGYALLADVMRRTNRVAIGRFVMRNREYLAALRPLGGGLAMETMHFADEVTPIEELRLPDGESVSDRELSAAERLVESLESQWDPDRYHDTFRERLMSVIEQKAQGEEIVVTAAPERPAEVIDLVAALEASLAEADGNGRGRRQTAPTGGASEAGGDLRGLSKDELYERARDADIPGRSQMSKDELVEALSSAEATRRSA